MTEQTKQDQNTVEEATGAQENAPEATEAHGDTGAENGAESPVEDDQPQEQDEQQNPNAEAKKYRLKLRETEAERDQLREQLTAHQQRQLAEELGGTLAVPGDLLTLTGTTVNDWTTEAGQIDAEKVHKAAQQLIDERPGLRAGVSAGGAYVPKIGDPVKQEERPTFADAFSTKNR